jgi:hypothetical protein
MEISIKPKYEEFINIIENNIINDNINNHINNDNYNTNDNPYETRKATLLRCVDCTDGRQY